MCTCFKTFFFIFDKPIWRESSDCFDYRWRLQKGPGARNRNHSEPSQILVIGQPLIPVTGVDGQGFVWLTARNMQCMQALIRLGRQASLFLSDAWLPMLFGFAHGAWIMGLRADSERADGSLTVATAPISEKVEKLESHKNNSQSNNNNNDPTLVTTAAERRLAFIAAEIQKVFDTAASELDEVALHHLVSALGQLSQQELECTLKQLKRQEKKTAKDDRNSTE